MTVTSSLKFLDIFWDLAYCAPLLPSDRMDNGHAAIRDTERDVFVFVRYFCITAVSSQGS